MKVVLQELAAVMLTIYVVSDATGGTAERMARSALIQFENAPVNLVRRPQVRSAKKLRAVVEEAAAGQSLILHTLVSDELRRLMVSEVTIARRGFAGHDGPDPRASGQAFEAYSPGKARADAAVGRGAEPGKSRRWHSHSATTTVKMSATWSVPKWCWWAFPAP